MARPVVVTVDLGTSGCRVAAFDETGSCVAEAQAQYATRSPQPGWAEQDPEQWWVSLVTSFRQVVALLSPAESSGQHGAWPLPIAAVSLTSQMAGLVLLGADGEPLTPALTWMDARAVAEAAAVSEAFGGRWLYERTGCPPRPNYSLPKLLWFQSRAGRGAASGTPAFSWDDIRWCFSPKDYVFWRLTGQALTDPSTAGASQLMNAATRDWDDRLLAWVGLSRACLPTIVPSTTAVPLQAAVAAELGLNGRAVYPVDPGHGPGDGFRERLPDGPQVGLRGGASGGLPVVVGAGDGVCANLGSGAVTVGMAACNVGTSAAVRVVTEAPTPDPAMRTALYPSADDLWVSNLATNNAGAVLAWFAEAFYEDRAAVGRVFEEAAAAPPGADGLLFLPYVFGERSPAYMSPGMARFIGISGDHRRAHFARSVVEGTVFVVRSLLDVLRASVPLEALTVTGRVATAPLYRQLLADVTGLPVRGTQQTGRETSLGAAVIGWVALGRWATLGEAVRHMVRLTGAILPTADGHARYQQVYERFRSCRETLLAGPAALEERQPEPGRGLSRPEPGVAFGPPSDNLAPGTAPGSRISGSAGHNPTGGSREFQEAGGATA